MAHPAVAGQSVRLLSEPQYVPPPTSAAVGADGVSSLTSPAVGVGGTYLFKFQAVVSGATKIKLIYVRPWEKGQAPADSFQITVQAIAPSLFRPMPELPEVETMRHGIGPSPAAASKGCASRGRGSRRSRLFPRLPSFAAASSAGRSSPWAAWANASCSNWTAAIAS